MCLILLAWQVDKRWPLVVAANRDEYHARPTAPCAWWPQQPDLLAGRDLAAGGTWMGVTRSGRFAALTNFRDPRRHRTDAPSRGALVSDYLRSDETPEVWLRRLARDAGRWNGFNLLAGDAERLWCFSSFTAQLQAVTPGVHGLSNHTLDEAWPKVVRGQSQLAAMLAASPVVKAAGNASDEEGLIVATRALLEDRTIPADTDLPDTGVGLERERLLSSALIVNPQYGTRSSTVLLLSPKRIVLDEATRALEGHVTATLRYDFVT